MVGAAAYLATVRGSCVEGGGGGGGGTEPAESRADQTARRNNATGAQFMHAALAHPFAEGGFRWVAKGTYTNGVRSGEPCVCKWFKSGHVDQSSFFDLDIKAMDKAHDLVKEWNNRNLINKLVKVNIPEVWVFTARHLLGKKVLQEPSLTTIKSSTQTPDGRKAKLPGQGSCRPLATSHITCLLVNSFFVICKVEFILMQLCSLIQSFCQEANCMA